MNERIRELAEQAGDSISEFHFGDYNIPNEFIEKFAELIVRECMRMCDCADVSLLEHNRPQEASGASSVKQFIAEHFGVDESKGWVCPKCGIDRTKDVCPKGHSAAMTGECPMIGEAQ